MSINILFVSDKITNSLQLNLIDDNIILDGLKESVDETLASESNSDISIDPDLITLKPFTKNSESDEQ